MRLPECGDRFGRRWPEGHRPLPQRPDAAEAAG